MNYMTPAEEWLAYRSGKCRLPSQIKAKIDRFYVYSGRIVALASGSSQILNIPLEPDSDFMVESIEIVPSLQTTSDDLFTAIISDTSFNQNWSNAAVPGRDIAGMGYAMKRLCFPQFVRPAASLNITLTNNSGSSSDYYVSFKGYRIVGLTDSERLMLAKRQWYQYVMTVPSIGAQTIPAPVQMQIMGDADFKIKRFLSWEAIKAIFTGTQVNGTSDILALFRDTTSGYQLVNVMDSLRNLFGTIRATYNAAPGTATIYTMGEPLEIAKPYTLKRNATLEGQFNNLANSATGLFRLVFEGAKLYD